MQPVAGMPTNINWITLVAAVTGLFAWLFPDIPAAVRMDILIVAFVIYVSVIPAVHTFWNHRGSHEDIDFSAQKGAHGDAPTYNPPKPLT